MALAWSGSCDPGLRSQLRKLDISNLAVQFSSDYSLTAARTAGC